MPKPDDKLIERYFANRCPPEEAETVLAWLATNEGQAFYDRYLRDRIAKQDVSAHHLVPTDTEKLLAGVYGRINQREGTLAPKVYRWYWAAAVVALLLVSTWIILYVIQPGQHVVETAYGETHRLTLDDGTTVMLNANSSVRYQTAQPRELWLTGEAFFEVTHTRDDAPFKVHTNDLTVKVLGTAFNVNTRHQKTDVVLRNGKVRLALESATVPNLTMNPGEKISYAHRDNELDQQVVDPNAYTAWTRGTIVFNHTPLREVFRWLEDTYGVTVKVATPAILSKEFTGEIVQNQEVLITLLRKSFGLKISQQGNTIYVSEED